MKKRMLALAMALMLAVSCFAAFPASAATPLTLTIESEETETPGTYTVTVSAQSGTPLEGFDLAFSKDSRVAVQMDPDYTNEVKTTGGISGIDSNLDSGGIYRFVYAGFTVVGGVINAQNPNGVTISSKTTLFTFNITATADLGATVTPFTITKSDFAYKSGTTYELYEVSPTVSDIVIKKNIKTLDSLSVNGVPKTIADSMTATVASNVTTATILAAAKSNGTVDVDGPATLAYGSNDYTITVTSEDESNTEVYNLTVTREYRNLGATVTFLGKDATGSKYRVELDNDNTNLSQFKAYAFDTVFGWTLVKKYGTETTFDITVANPSATLKIEVLKADSAQGTDTALTYEKTLIELGQIYGLSASFANNKTAYSVGETVTVNASASLPVALSEANYEISFPGSGKGQSGTLTAVGGVVSVSAGTTATKAGTYKASVRIFDASNSTNEVTTSISYTVVDTVPSNLADFTGNKLKVTGTKLINEPLSVALPSIESNGPAAVSYRYRFVSPVQGGEKYNFGSASAISIPKPGVYFVYADLYSGGVNADTAYSTVTIGRDSGSVVIDSLGQTLSSGTYTFTVNAPNATQYLFVRRDSTGYRTVQAWSPTNTWTWTPSRDGIYQIVAYVKGAGAGSYEAVESTTVTIGTLSAVAPTTTVSQLVAGKATTLTVTNAAANPGCEYAFEIYDAFSNKYIFSGYSDSATYTFVPQKAREYKITTLVKATGNSGAYDNKATLPASETTFTK